MGSFTIPKGSFFVIIFETYQVQSRVLCLKMKKSLKVFFCSLHLRKLSSSQLVLYAPGCRALGRSRKFQVNFWHIKFFLFYELLIFLISQCMFVYLLQAREVYSEWVLYPGIKSAIVFRLFLRKCMKEMFFLCAHRAQHGSFSAPHF